MLLKPAFLTTLVVLVLRGRVFILGWKGLTLPSVVKLSEVKFKMGMIYDSPNHSGHSCMNQEILVTLQMETTLLRKWTLNHIVSKIRKNSLHFGVGHV